MNAKVFSLALLPLLFTWVMAVDENEINNTTLATASDVQELEDQAGMLPDNMLYFLKDWSEKIQLFLAFTDEKKAELESRFADNRLAELALAKKKGLTNLIDKISEKYSEKINRTQELIERISEKAVEDVKEKIGREFITFNNSVNNGLLPSEIIIENNSTLELLSSYTNQTIFSPEELRDFVYDLLTQARNSTDQDLKKELVKLSDRLIKEALKTISNEEVDDDAEISRAESLALRVGANTAKHIAVLERISEDANEHAVDGLMRALNASQMGHAQAILSVTNKARFEWDNEEVKNMIEDAKDTMENFREQLKNKLEVRAETAKNRLEELKERIKSGREDSNDTQESEIEDNSTN